ERVRERGAAPIVLGVGEALVLIDQERQVAMGATGLKHGAERRRRVLPHARRKAAYVPLFHLEWRTRRGERRHRVGDRQSSQRLDPSHLLLTREPREFCGGAPTAAQPVFAVN